MAHKFDVKNKNKLDSAERRKILPPEETLMKLGLDEGDRVADIGCGIGYFSIPAAKIAGSRGYVFAFDISQEMLKETLKRATANNISNLHTILIPENDIIFGEKVSFVLMSNLLHEIDNKLDMLRQARNILRDKGRLAIVEWQKAETKYGPPIDHRIDKNEVVEMLAALGFNCINKFDIGENFYGITAELV